MRWESNNELYHYGIKGQKWGVRNYQNEDGTLTSAGKERYGIGASLDRLHKKQEDYALKKQRKINDESLRKQYKQEKKEFRDLKTLDKIANSKASKRQIALERQYESKGLNKQQAAILAYRKAKIEKFLKIAGGLSLASLVGFAGYKYNKNSKIAAEKAAQAKALEAKKYIKKAAKSSYSYNFSDLHTDVGLVSDLIWYLI